MLLIIMLKCKGYICKTLLCIDRFESYLKYHISHITSKIHIKIIGIIGRLRHFVTTNTLLTIYRPLILPYLSYCFAVWGQAAQTYLNQILVVQKHALYYCNFNVFCLLLISHCSSICLLIAFQ